VPRGGKEKTASGGLEYPTRLRRQSTKAAFTEFKNGGWAVNSHPPIGDKIYATFHRVQKPSGWGRSNPPARHHPAKAHGPWGAYILGSRPIPTASITDAKTIPMARINAARSRSPIHLGIQWGASDLSSVLLIVFDTSSHRFRRSKSRAGGTMERYHQLG